MRHEQGALRECTPYMDNLTLFKKSTLNIPCKETAYIARPNTNTMLNQ
jgi:hypothetical protein